MEMLYFIMWTHDEIHEKMSRPTMACSMSCLKRPPPVKKWNVNRNLCSFPMFGGSYRAQKCPVIAYDVLKQNFIGVKDILSDQINQSINKPISHSVSLTVHLPISPFVHLSICESDIQSVRNKNLTIVEFRCYMSHNKCDIKKYSMLARQG